jgi:hypothetical protein
VRTSTNPTGLEVNDMVELIFVMSIRSVMSNAFN